MRLGTRLAAALAIAIFAHTQAFSQAGSPAGAGTAGGTGTTTSPTTSSPTATATDETTLSLEPAGAEKPAPQADDGWAYLFRMILVLALVVGVVYGVLLFVKRVSKKQKFDSSGIKILANSQLGPGRTLHVVAIGSQALLVGVADGSVNLVAELTDKEAIDAMHLKADEAPQAGKRDFFDTLSGFLRTGPGRKPGESDADYLKRQRDRLKKL